LLFDATISGELKIVKRQNVKRADITPEYYVYFVSIGIFNDWPFDGDRYHVRLSASMARIFLGGGEAGRSRPLVDSGVHILHKTYFSPLMP